MDTCLSHVLTKCRDRTKKKKKKEGVLNNHNFQVSFLKSFALSFFLQVLKRLLSLLS